MMGEKIDKGVCWNPRYEDKSKWKEWQIGIRSFRRGVRRILEKE